MLFIECGELVGFLHPQSVVVQLTWGMGNALNPGTLFLCQALPRFSLREGDGEMSG